MKALMVGGAMQDSVAIIEDAKIEQMAMRNAEASFLLLEEGKKTEASEISTHCGGGAVNAAVAMARIGLEVSVLVKVGKDYKARNIINKLKEENISDRWVLRHDTAPTGSSVIIASHSRDAAIFTFRGANTLIKPEDLKDEAFEADLVYISSLSNESADCFPILAEKAKDSGAFVATNPGIRQLSSRSKAFHDTLKDIDLISINEREATALVPRLIESDGMGGEPLPVEDGEELPLLVTRGFAKAGFEMSLSHFLRCLHKRGVKNVLVTSGKDGAFLSSGDELLFCPALKDVTVAGTAGGGDAFASTLTAYLVLGHKPEDAMRAATVNAASVISFADTQTGLLRHEELHGLLQSRKQDMAVRKWKL